MNQYLIDFLKNGTKLTREVWKNQAYIFLKDDKLFITYLQLSEKYTKEANQENLDYNELFQNDWVVFPKD